MLREENWQRGIFRHIALGDLEFSAGFPPVVFCLLNSCSSSCDYQNALQRFNKQIVSQNQTVRRVRMLTVE